MPHAYDLLPRNVRQTRWTLLRNLTCRLADGLNGVAQRRKPIPVVSDFACGGRKQPSCVFRLIKHIDK
jgi:hypothetical protein